MKPLWENSLFRSRYLLAFLAGLVLTAAFPNLGVAGLAWVAPGLILAAALGKRGWEVFRIGYVAALAHYLSMLYWLLLIPYRWHGIPFGPALGWLALGAFLALFPAAWVWLVCPGQGAKSPVHRAQATGQGPQSAVHSPESDERRELAGEGGPDSASLVTHHASRITGTPSLPQSWLGRTLWALGGAAVWVATEMVLARIFGGFPWDLLGVSQYRMTPLIQMASVTGVYGVSFLIVWFSLSLLSAGVMLLRRPTARSVWMAEIFLPVLVVAVLFNLGFRQLRHESPVTRTLKMTLVQPSIPQTLIWNSENDDQRFADLLRLSEQALSNRTDVLVWPEAAVPKMLRYDTNTFEALTGLARRHHVWMIVGSDDAEPPRHPTSSEEVNYYNSSFLISPEGKLLDRYIKRGLVIFGEYVPLEKWLPLFKYFTPIEGGFTPGTKAEPFELATLEVNTSVLICFEDVFPHLARGDVSPETDFLLNLTNDGWFGEGAAQWQQAMTGLFRAVENRVPLVRCCNNGLTCWIDAYGRVREIFRDRHGTVYGPGFLTIELPVMAPGESHSLTFYTRHGDWFGWACVVVACWFLVRRLVPRFLSSSSSSSSS